MARLKLLEIYIRLVVSSILVFTTKTTATKLITSLQIGDYMLCRNKESEEGEATWIAQLAAIYKTANRTNIEPIYVYFQGTQVLCFRGGRERTEWQSIEEAKKEGWESEVVLAKPCPQYICFLGILRIIGDLQLGLTQPIHVREGFLSNCRSPLLEPKDVVCPVEVYICFMPCWQVLILSKGAFVC